MVAQTNGTAAGLIIDSIPAELRERPQWVLWKTELRGGKPTKVPYQVNGRTKAQSNNPATWGTFAEAAAEQRRGWDGIGYVFAADDPFYGIDLDSCYNAETGELTPWAAEVVEGHNTYAEISPSGQGVKLIGRGKLPDGKGRAHKLQNVPTFGDGKQPEIACYDNGRFWCITGRRLPNSPATCEERQPELDSLFAKWFAKSNGHANSKPHTNGKPASNGATNSKPHGGNVADALEAMRRIKTQDGSDGSRRLLAYACRAVEYDLTDAEAIEAIRAVAQERPFPVAFSDADIERRLRDAEQMTQRGKRPENFGNSKTVEIEETDAETGETTRRKIRVPLTIAEILADMGQRTDDWPRRVGNTLFYDAGESIAWLANQSALFGWLGSNVGRIDWHKATGCVSRGEVYEHLRNTAKQYAAIETLPHEPAMSGHYYACKTPAPGNGKALRGLVARYRPATTIDGDLLLAAIVTLFWGGEGGTRPAIVLTADAGRGAGKTKTAESITYVAGGHIDVSCQEEIGQVKQRALTPAALSIRAAMLDNVKTLKFSWAELESLITSRVISGKQMYTGEAQRPNTLTWFITLNGVSLATDMAQRAVIIQLDKGPNRAAWFEETLGYIDQHRAAIVADCIAFLRSPTAPLPSYSRWASWERDILSRLPEPTEAQAVIAERQGASDAETDETEIVEGYFAERLAGLGYDPAAEVVRLPVEIVATWYCAATRDRMRTPAVSRHLSQLATEGKLQRIGKDASRKHGRCFLWTGENTTPSTAIANDLRDRITSAQARYQEEF